MNDVKFIIGEAGTAKTTYLKNIINELCSKKIKIACLAFTHSAVNNLKQDGLKNVVYKTIHAFLGIIPTEVKTIRNKKCCDYDFDYLIIDEFTLIPIDLFNFLCSEYFNYNNNGKIVIAGDLLQLPPPDTNEFITENLFNNDVFKEIQTDFLTSIKIAKHLSQTAFNSDWFKDAKKLILNKNFRNGSNVKTILDNAINNKFDIIDYREVINFVNDGYVVISSKYCHLKKVMKTVNNVNNVNKVEHLNNVVLSPVGLINVNRFASDKIVKQPIYLTENIDQNFTNGDIVEIIKVDNDKQVVRIQKDKICIDMKPNEAGVYPLMPVNFITVHKAQGKTFKKIIVILNDMFELSMLYTAITRAQEDVKFICLGNDKERVFKELEEQNKAFNLLKEIVFKVIK